MSLPQLCYSVAYFILPRYAFKDLAKLTDLCVNTPSAAGPFFYVMAARTRGVEPDFADAQLFQWHHGQLNGGYEYFVLEYPTPPAIDMLGVSPKDVIDGRASFVLAPHFSAIVRGVEDVHYFVLGQAPMGGGTTLRCILPEGTNCNLGPGPKPELSAFLDAVRGRVARQR